MRVTFMASEKSWGDAEWTGHVFMMIAIPLDIGVKEDGYGFYSKEGGKGMIDGPGVVKDEVKANASRLSRVSESLERVITKEQRRALLALAQKWNGKDYELLNDNCISFVADAAKTLGMTVPERTRGELPAAFLKRLKAAN